MGAYQLLKESAFQLFWYDGESKNQIIFAFGWA